MKKAICLLICVICLFSLSCQGKTNENASTLKMSESITEIIGSESNEVYCDEYAENEKHLDNDILSGRYGLLMEAPSLDMIEKYAVSYSQSPYGTEYGIFLMKNSESAEKMELFISNKIADMQRNAVNYPGVDTSLIDNCKIKIEGRWLYYIMAENQAEAEKIITDEIR